MFNYLDVDLNRQQWEIVKKIEKDSYKRTHRGHRDTLKKSLLDEPRIYSANEDWETYKEFGFLSHRTDLTDDEINELVEDMRMIICSPYDCTGKHFTRWIETHRNPSGLVSYIHTIGIDV